jgi:hypothetical protein
LCREGEEEMQRCCGWGGRGGGVIRHAVE